MYVSTKYTCMCDMLEMGLAGYTYLSEDDNFYDDGSDANHAYGTNDTPYKNAIIIGTIP